MPITTIKIHPAIGIARLGNSPDEFFIGPERPGDHAPPAGGYKDAQCRVKRQAARFRLFAYDQNGALVQEITAADADISWTVHLVNKKAAADTYVGTGQRNASVTGADRQKLVIDPGARTLNGPDQQAKFDSGTFTLPGQSPVSVPLGEIRTDDDGHLLVLGGFGKSSTPNNSGFSSFADNDGWHDDIADGPVTATVTLNGGGGTFTAVGAWVITAPPKFAPPLDNIITLYDRLFDYAVQQGWLTAPATPSYTQDIYPILERARTALATNASASGHHTWTHPVTSNALRSSIFNKLKAPGGGGNMPELSACPLNDGRLTATQYGVMQQWSSNNFTNDWAGPPAPPATITPAGLDRAALENCVGGAFYPGIEAGAFLISAPGIYQEPFRLNHGAVAPGDVTARMAVPWQSDFYACGSFWWPVPRPNNVIPDGASSYADWTRGIGSTADMVAEWHTLGFVVEQGGAYVEVDRCDSTYINLLTPSLNFADVPQGPGGMTRKQALAVVFEVGSPGGAVALEWDSGPSHPRLQRLTTAPVSVGPTTPPGVATARLWLTYQTGAVGEVITDTVRVKHAASGRTWDIALRANTVARKKAAVALVLDRSGSMNEDRGDGGTKIQSLKEAAGIFVDVMLEQDGAAVIQYNQDAQQLAGVTALGPATDPFDSGRTTVKGAVAGLTAGGATSIGDGIFEGRQALNAASGYDTTALVVMTDGKENSPRMIADVAGQINEQTFALGLGTPQNISAAALQTISGNHGGYLLITGAITTENRFLLTKYFLQILAGITNAQVVLDPQGELWPGATHRIPFQITDADGGMDVILLTPAPQLIDFRLETPTGQILDPPRAQLDPQAEFVRSQGVSYYRVGLPITIFPDRPDQTGTWHALLQVGQPPIGVRGSAGDYTHGEGRRALPYNLLVHGYSDIAFRAAAHPSGFSPGATIALDAALSEYGAPFDRPAQVWAEVSGPDGSAWTVTLAPGAPGQYRGAFTAARPGIYRARVRAVGTSQRGWPFQREQTLTANVWQGGDRDASGDPNGDLVRWLHERDERLCRLLSCLLGGGLLTDEMQRRCRELGIDLESARACLKRYCASRSPLDADAAAEAAANPAPAEPARPAESSRPVVSEELAGLLRRLLGSSE